MKLRPSVYSGTLAICIAVVIAGGYSRKAVTSDLVGDYVVDYPYGRETLTLSADGKYFQNFSPKEKTRQAAGATGTWDTDGEHVMLQDALVVDDFYGDLSPSYADRKHRVSGLLIESRFGKITFREGANVEYRYQK